MDNLEDIALIAPYQAKIAKVVFEEIETNPDAADDVMNLSKILSICDGWDNENEMFVAQCGKISNSASIEQLLAFESKHLERMKEFYLTVCAPILDAQN